MEATLRTLLVVGFAGLAIFLRLDAARFGSAEYEEELPAVRHAAWRRASWYALGLALAAVIYLVDPAPGRDLRLGVGDQRLAAVLLGLLLGALGTGVAAGFAWYRYRRLRLPPTSSYPAAIANSILTALVDEVTFRGALLGLLLMVPGLGSTVAIVVQTLGYGLATRLGAPGRSKVMLLVFMGVGLVAGWATVATGGIAAAVVGHAITRFAVFVTTGHAGQVRPLGREPEEEAADRLPPEGWEVVREGHR